MKHALRAICLYAAFLVCGCGAVQEVFSSDVRTKAKPWTTLRFHNDPDSFQFAIVSDRTGGHRPGVFSRAVERLNWLQPEFVMCVGDLIQGYTTDADALAKQWAELESRTTSLEMPFFYVPGNHDTSNADMMAVWEKKFGRRYYSFVYRSCLFLVLDSQEGPSRPSSGLSSAQVAYAKDILVKHRGVRWTFVFFHQPLWANEERAAARAESTGEKAPEGNFAEIQEALKGRNHTVFAGHTHTYLKYVRHGANYYVLSTTGGANDLSGADLGRYDHVVWVTMTPRGPAVTNLSLDGILPDDIQSEEDFARRRELRRALDGLGLRAERGATELPKEASVEVANPCPEELSVAVEWSYPEGCPWSVTPTSGEFELAAGESKKLLWEASCTGNLADPGSLKPFPVAAFSARTPSRRVVEDYERTLLVDTWPYREKRQALEKALTITAPRPEAALLDRTIVVGLASVLDVPLETELRWTVPPESGWRIVPEASTLELPALESGAAQFKVSYLGSLPMRTLPVLTSRSTVAGALVSTVEKPFPAELMEPLLRKHHPQISVPPAAGSPTVDGQLNDAIWQGAPLIGSLPRSDLAGPASAPTSIWMFWDETSLYLAVRCTEPNLDELSLRATKRDTSAWSDDSVEVFLDMDLSRETYYQIIVSAANVVYDGYERNREWNGDFASATGREEGAWTLEMSIPWKTLGQEGPPKGKKIGFNIARNRIQADQEFQQWAPTLSSAHRPELFGIAEFPLPQDD